MKKLLKIITIVIVVFLFVFLLIEMFFSNTLSLFIKFKQLEHYENRADILTVFSIVTTAIINITVYSLSKRIDEQNNIEKESKKFKSICVVYDYLNEVILHIKKTVFKEKEDYYDLNYNETFMQEVYNLNNSVLSEEDIKVLSKLNSALKNFCTSTPATGKDATHKLSIKWVYTILFDRSMEISSIEEINDLADIDLLLNPAIVNILSKLRKGLNQQYCKNVCNGDFKLIVTENKKEIIVEKFYGNRHSVKNGNGFAKIYASVFCMINNEELNYKNGGVIYEGHLKKYEFDGEGTYYYYKGNGAYVHSADLIDNNAKRIKRKLQNAGLSIESNVIVEGQFKNDVMIAGIIKSLDHEFEDMEI